MDLFRKFVARPFIVDPGIVGRPHDRDHGRNAGWRDLWQILTRAEQRRGLRRFGRGAGGDSRRRSAGAGSGASVTTGELSCGAGGAGSLGVAAGSSGDFARQIRLEARAAAPVAPASLPRTATARSWRSCRRAGLRPASATQRRRAGRIPATPAARSRTHNRPRSTPDHAAPVPRARSRPAPGRCRHVRCVRSPPSASPPAGSGPR